MYKPGDKEKAVEIGSLPAKPGELTGLVHSSSLIWWVGMSLSLYCSEEGAAYKGLETWM